MTPQDWVQSWFRLENYDRVRTFGKEEWRSAILNRLRYLKILEIFGLSTQSRTDSWLGGGAVEYWQDIKYHGVANFSVSSHECLRIENIVLKEVQKKEFLKKLLKQGFADFPNENSAEKKAISALDYMNLHTGENKPEASNFIKEYKELYQKLRLSFPFNQYAYMQVNLSATDEQLVESFVDWLHNKRLNQKANLRKRFTANDFSGWAQDKVLPYYDLTTIARLEGILLPNHLIGDLLFPYEDKADVGERVRKVTKPKAKKIMTPATVEALWLQGDPV